MRDLDSLLDSRVCDAAGRAAEQPDFAGLRASGRRRRTRTRAVVAAGFVLVLGMGVTALQLAPTTDSAPPVDPAPATPSPTTTQRVSAEQIVDDPRSRLAGLVVSDDSPEARASIWSLCGRRSCDDRRYAVAITDDGFATRTVLPRTSSGFPVVKAAGAGTFVVRWGRDDMLVGPDGERVRLDIDRAAGPLEEGQVLVPSDLGLAPYSAIDPATGAGHRLSAPDGIRDLMHTPDGQLRGIVQDFGARTAAVVWSDDGGTTWVRHDLPTTETSLFNLIPTPDDATFAVVAGADGATLFPFIAVHRSTDGGRTWQTFSQDGDPRAYVGGNVVLPDGRLVADVDAWSDQRAGRPGRNPTGLWVSRGADWSELEVVAAGVPFDVSGEGESPPFELLAAVATAEGTSLYASDVTGDGNLLGTYESTDGGETWSRVTVR